MYSMPKKKRNVNETQRLKKEPGEHKTTTRLRLESQGKYLTLADDKEKRQREQDDRRSGNELQPQDHPAQRSKDKTPEEQTKATGRMNKQEKPR